MVLVVLAVLLLNNLMVTCCRELRMRGDLWGSVFVYDSELAVFSR